MVDLSNAVLALGGFLAFFFLTQNGNTLVENGRMQELKGIDLETDTIEHVRFLHEQQNK